MDKTMVSRSTFQRVVEENKKLLYDLKILVTLSDSDEMSHVFDKWQTKFRRDQELTEMINEWGKDYIKNHPEDEAVKFVKSLKDGTHNTP